jgi:flagellar basal body-associated protein FliL
MYCSTCGTAVTPGLSYCNRCGAELTAKERKTPDTGDVSVESLVWALVAVTVGGIGAVMVLMAVLSKVFGKEILLAVMLVSFLLVLSTTAMFLWLLLRRVRRADESSDAARRNEQETKELGAATRRALQEPLASVTEHTTRTFEPVPVERKSE